METLQSNLCLFAQLRSFKKRMLKQGTARYVRREKESWNDERLFVESDPKKIHLMCLTWELFNTAKLAMCATVK